MSKAKALMFLGTGSDVGKSVLAAAFCRIFRQEGYKVAPFKAQNMALNSYITPEGGEMGRAQVVQAEAAGIDPHVDMNPILLKPTSQMGSQVIVLGKAIGNFSAKEYYDYKKELVSVVRESYGRLDSQNDIIVMEGAGSAVELNLKRHDLVNMAMAEMADARCILVGDIDRGGIFAALLGSFSLLEPSEQARICGFIVNKLRGDPRLFADGTGILESRSGRPVLGVVPWFNHIALPEEDSVALGRRMGKDGSPDREMVAVGVVRLPFISNYTDFDCFEQDPRVRLVYFDKPAQVFDFDAVMLPGSKNTIEDLAALDKSGMADAVRAYYKTGGTVVGVCGGYQMLGKVVRDPYGVESALSEIPGLGILEMETEMYPEKITSQVEAVLADGAQDSTGGGEPLRGYEIHMGRSTSLGSAVALFRIMRRDGRPADDILDGLVQPGGRGWGTYIHGIFDNDGFRDRFLREVAERAGKKLPGAPGSASYRRLKEEQYDLLAEFVRRHVDVGRVLKAMDIG